MIPVGYAHILARISLTGDQDEMAVTFGTEVEFPPFDQTSADAISALIGTFLKGTMCTMYRFEGIDAAVAIDGTDPVHWLSTNGNGAGTRGSSAVPQNTALVFRKNTALGGRKNRGRFFVPGVFETDVDNVGALTSSAVTGFNTLGANLIAGLDSAGHRMVVLHTSPSDMPTPVTSLTLDSRVGTQRRRLR